MKEDIFFEIHQGLPREGPGRNTCTRKAFRMLPEMDKPRILDVGCGPGAPTMELARLTQGNISGLDIHQPYLDRLANKIEKAGLSNRVRVINRSMFEMDFPEDSFDIIWAEGSIFIIGFERGLREWRRFIKPKGFLVVHEVAWLRNDPPQEIQDYWKEQYPDIKTISENLERIPGCGYDIIGYFPLPEDAWWKEYYGPLEKRIRLLKKKYAGNTKALSVLHNEELEIEMYKKYSSWYGSVFFVMQRA
jgi:SAM-dependent methyltransferase